MKLNLLNRCGYLYLNNFYLLNAIQCSKYSCSLILYIKSHTYIFYNYLVLLVLFILLIIGSTKKGAKKECAIAAIKYTWKFDFHTNKTVN